MRRFLFIALLTVVNCLTAQEPAHPLIPATWNIRSDELFDMVKELASPEYGGRLTGSPGYAKAAGYLAGKFSEAGLIPPEDCPEYFQKFRIPYTVVLPGCELALVTSGGEKAYRYYDEFMPGSTSASSELTAGVVFAGFGISAPELGYDDYAGINVKGKFVVIRPEAPVAPSIGDDKFAPWLPYSMHQYKMENAIRHGAAGILYHYGPLANTNNDYHSGLLVTMVGERVVADLFDGTGIDYNTLVASILETRKPASLDLGKKVRIRNRTVHYPDAEGMNVIGVLPGSDPELKDQYILIGGHLDHCGLCWELCPGANDNASGIAVLAGVAKALGGSGLSFRRTLVFIGFGGEESGLAGSRKYLANPPFPLNSTTGFINIDCVGVGPHLHAGGGNSYPDLYKAIEMANQLFVHRTLTASNASLAGRPRTDAAILNKAGIPAISFSSYGGSGAYHTPEDTPETIWPETLEDLATLLTIALADLAGIYTNSR